MRSRVTGALCAGLLLLAFAAAGPAAAQGTKSGSSFAAQATAVDQPGRREWVWQGRDSLTVEGSGTMQYEPGGAPRIIITGDQEAVANMEVDGGVIRQRQGFSWHGKSRNLNILVQGVTLNRFEATGSVTMNLGSLQRDQLTLRISGSGAINAQGQARSLSLNISGSGRANLNALSANDAGVTISGSGVATLGNVGGNASIEMNGSGAATLGAVAGDAHLKLAGSGKALLGPVQGVDARIAGSGSVRLRSAPTHSNYDITGSGSVLLVAADGKTTELARMPRGGPRGRREAPPPSP